VDEHDCRVSRSQMRTERTRHNQSGLILGRSLDTTIEYAGTLPSPECEIFIGLLGGAAGRVDAEATAYAHRDANFVMNVHGRWQEAGQDEGGIGWARAFFDAAAPFATGSVYVNFMTAEESDRIAAAYGPNYDRLVEIKNHYDPENLFRMNQNIKPTK